jgi:hypothetical protein
MKIKILITLLYLTSINAALVEDFHKLQLKIEVINGLFIQSQAILRCKDLSNVKLFYSEGDFYAIWNKRVFKIERSSLDKTLRGIPKEYLLQIFSEGGYLKLNRSSDGTYNLDLDFRILGGGTGGATVGFYAGKFATHFVAHGTILVVSSLTGPAAPATAASLEATFLPWIEATSNTIGIGCGILGGIFTGPA